MIIIKLFCGFLFIVFGFVILPALLDPTPMYRSISNDIIIGGSIITVGGMGIFGLVCLAVYVTKGK
jgi:hypothetical protein